MKKNNYISLLVWFFSILNISSVFANDHCYASLSINNHTSSTTLKAYPYDIPIYNPTYIPPNQLRNVDLSSGGSTMTSAMTIYDSNNKEICRVEPVFTVNNMHANPSQAFPPVYYNVKAHDRTDLVTEVRPYGPTYDPSSLAVILLSGPGFFSPFNGNLDSDYKCTLTFFKVSGMDGNFRVDMAASVTDATP